jgi:hypothetical protein
LIEVPGPEPDWERAAEYQGGKRNPALQHGMWEYAAAGLRLVAGLSPPLDALAARLQLEVETSWEDLGPVDAALFSIRKTDFALTRTRGNPRPDTFVWVGRNQDDVDGAIESLLHALGIGMQALTFRGDLETGFTELGTGPDSTPDSGS